MKKSDKELYKQIDEIFWNDWDPIGINNNEVIRDEYRGYVPSVLRLKQNGADPKKIADRLYQLETNLMGMNGDMDHCLFIAQKIIEL